MDAQIDRAIKESGGWRPSRPFFLIARLARAYPSAALGTLIFAVVVFTGVFAPYLGTVNPTKFSPVTRLRDPSMTYWFGTDGLGRDVYSRVLFGTRVSLTIGLAVALLASIGGLAIGLVAGFSRIFDGVIMRVMDGLMSIPPILLAVALMALTRASIENVIFAITIPELPRVARLVRGSVLGQRDLPYVEAARLAGVGTTMIIIRHVLPNVLAPVIVQSTYICAGAMITEAILSFIGAGVPPSIPSWGNIMAEGRALWQLKFHLILFPALFLSLTVLAINLLGDGLRDAIDPRSKAQILR